MFSYIQWQNNRMLCYSSLLKAWCEWSLQYCSFSDQSNGFLIHRIHWVPHRSMQQQTAPALLSLKHNAKRLSLSSLVCEVVDEMLSIPKEQAIHSSDDHLLDGSWMTILVVGMASRVIRAVRRMWLGWILRDIIQIVVWAEVY